MLHGLASLASLAAALQVASALPTLSPRTNPSEPPPVVDVGYARYQGALNETAGVYTWRGIRYASAARFQAPRTPDKDSSGSVLNATEYGAICWQASVGANTTEGLPQNRTVDNETQPESEDCLFLDVLAPAGSCEGADLPVAVYIHGGGYAAGDAAAGTEFEAFARHVGEGVVIIRIQYRLGPFGFLAGKAIKDNGVLNAGFLDQQFALQWVQRHVSKFGGNPEHVTIWGESAGAGSVLNHVIANGGNTVKALGLKKPLFKGALVSSVFVPLQVEGTSDWAEKLYDQLVSTTNCTGQDSSYACLESLDESTLAAAGYKDSASFPYGFWEYVPVIDGTFLTDRASVLLKKGKKNLNGEVFLGTQNTDEGFGFTDPTLLNSETTDKSALASQFDSVLAGLFPLLTTEQRKSVADQYPISEAPTSPSGTNNITFDRISTVIAESTFVCPTYWSAEAFGSSAHKGIFNYGPATHAFDTSYYIGRVWDGKKSVSSVQSFTGALGGFVKAFDPNKNPASSSVNPFWPTFDTGKQLMFDTEVDENTLSPADPEVVKTSSLTSYGTSQRAKCDFWRGSISKNAGL